MVIMLYPTLICWRGEEDWTLEHFAPRTIDFGMPFGTVKGECQIDNRKCRKQLNHSTLWRFRCHRPGWR